MTKPIRVLVSTDSHSDETFRIALDHAEAICAQRSPAVQDVILLTHTNSQLVHTSLARALGDSAVKALSKGPVPLQWGATLRTETMRTLHQPSREAVVIVYYAEIKILDLVDGIANLAGVVVVPEFAGEADTWKDRWGATVHGQPASTSPPVLIDDPIFVRALETLSRIANLSTGLVHPRDKEMANEILRILRAKGHADQSVNIKSWAIRRGWKPRGATELEALSRKIWSLQNKPSLSKFHNAKERYKRWIEEVSSGSVLTGGD